MSYADHDHRGDYADQRHDHDGDYAEKHHRHYDLEREDERLQVAIREWGAQLGELSRDLEGALGRIRALEGQTPRARQLQAELDATLADNAAAGYGEDYCGEPDDDEDDHWRETYTCSRCGALIGVFIGHGDGWHHYRGEGTAASPVELFDAGHEATFGLGGAQEIQEGETDAG